VRRNSQRTQVNLALVASHAQGRRFFGLYMKKKLCFIFGSAIIAGVLGLAACAPVKILNGITPSSSFEKTKDVSFGTGERDEMDIYRADTPKSGAPVLVFVHGGSWDSGSKDIYKFLAEGFTKSGYDIAVPNYTLLC